MSVALTRTGATETIQVEAKVDLDRQGKPNYGTAASIQARVVREAKMVMRNDGSEVRTTVTVWVSGTQTTQPAEEDRLTLASGVKVIVAEVKEGRALRNKQNLDHTRVRCKEE